MIFPHSVFSLRDIFLKWDNDQDGFIDSTELRKGLSSLNLGVPEGVIGI
jgi:Ca2+-binding EF-hand superfamily protein